MSYSTVVEKTAKNPNFEKKVCPAGAGVSLGTYELNIVSICVSFKATVNTLVEIGCSSINTYAYNTQQEICGVTAPLALLHIFGASGEKKKIELTPTCFFEVTGQLDRLQFYLTNLETRKVERLDSVDMYVHVCLKRVR